MSWHAISPWWSLVPVAMILIYGLMRSNYEHYCHLESGLNQSIANVTQENSTFKAKIAELEKQLQSKTDLSEKEIQILAAAVEGLASDCAGIIILNPQLIFIGTICLSLGDTIERTEYQEAIDSLVRDEWIKQHGSRYEPTVKGWNKGKEILASEEGKAMMLELHRKFPAT